jgi:hypothetical protein
MKTEILIALVSLGGVALGSLSTLAVTFLNRRFDDRRHLRQVAIEAAVQNWKQDIEIANTIGKLTRQNVGINPLDTYIIHMLQLAELMSSKGITAENVQDKLARIYEITDAVSESAKNRAKTQNEGKA